MSNKKSIHTVVEDIYNLFSDESKIEIAEKDMKAFTKAVASSIKKSVEEDRKQKGKLRMSLVGHPNRKIWYEVNKAPQETLSPQDRIKFLYGDILEHLLVLLVKTAGHKVTDEQKEVSINGVVGHLDAKVDDVVVDFKSASAFGFKKFKNSSLVGDDPFGYIAQISSYAQAEGQKEAAFIAIDKQSGEIACLNVHDLEMINSEKRISFLQGIVEKETPPERCYEDVPEGKSGNRRLDTGCNYCQFKAHCWKDANGGKGLRAFMYANGVKYLTKVANEPDVPEIAVE